MNKKAVHVWISYVILIGFVVALAAFLYTWMIDYSSEKSLEIKERVYDTELCDSIAASMTACNISQTLYINVTNRGDIRINQLVFRLENDNGYVFEEINTTIKPKNTKNFSFSNVKFTNVAVGVVPATFKDNAIIICTEKEAKAELTNQTSC